MEDLPQDELTGKPIRHPTAKPTGNLTDKPTSNPTDEPISELVRELPVGPTTPDGLSFTAGTLHKSCPSPPLHTLSSHMTLPVPSDAHSHSSISKHTDPGEHAHANHTLVDAN